MKNIILFIGVLSCFGVACLTFPSYNMYIEGNYREFQPCNSNAVYCFWNAEYQEMTPYQIRHGE